ncbi:glutaminase [Nocardioides sambongensis]|uniref:glutaminase n=1 Tax=Nocardioides sambongensis TaxID=2589074 RepID=UPI00112CA98B|nr:glutaminase [Nocardioides sambongensis]
MQTPVPDYLLEVLESCGSSADGAVADYIPELAAADPDRLAVALATMDGQVHAAGDATVRFTIQSISKPFAYALALRDHGLPAVLASVGVEPSGDAFNEISLEEATGRPRNPMINVGALVTHSLVGDASLEPDARDRLLLDGLSSFAGRPLDVDERVFDSELGTADRNLALAYLVRSYGVTAADPEEVVRGYTRQCAIRVDVRDLAVMAATLAHGGVNPVTGAAVVPAWVARQVLSVMATCGMYDAAGDWFSHVGIPAKSGVAGGLIGALPGQVGIGTFSPRLDEFGNSVRGVRVCERLSDDMGLHLMGTPATGAHVLRRSVRDGHAHTLELQGAVRFSGAEAVLRAMSDLGPEVHEVTVDLSRITSIDDVGRRMLLEGVRRLGLDGVRVALDRPDYLERSPDQS